MVLTHRSTQSSVVTTLSYELFATPDRTFLIPFLILMADSISGCRYPFFEPGKSEQLNLVKDTTSNYLRFIQSTLYKYILRSDVEASHRAICK
jgi:hypothetical protein